jgi:hypothetical protein
VWGSFFVGEFVFVVRSRSWGGVGYVRRSVISVLRFGNALSVSCM